jgi:hypothetical protein
LNPCPRSPRRNTCAPEGARPSAFDLGRRSSLLPAEYGALRAGLGAQPLAWECGHGVSRQGIQAPPVRRSLSQHSRNGLSAV